MVQSPAPEQRISRIQQIKAHLVEWVERRRWLLMMAIFVAMLILIVLLLVANRAVVRNKEILQATISVLQVQVVEVRETAIWCETRCVSPTPTPTWTGASVSIATFTPVPVLTTTSVATYTLTPTLIVTYAPTLTPTSTYTPTSTPAPTYTPTPTPTPTDTSTPTPSPTATREPPTPSDTPTPLPSPVVWSIIPTATVQSSGPAFPVTITGENFRSGVASRLDENIPITVTYDTTTTITGMLSPDMPVGVYGLIVTNPDGQTGMLSPAFIVYDVDGPTIPLDSPLLATFGTEASAPYDARLYKVQLIFFEVPADLSEDVYVLIFDADTGTSLTDDDRGDDVYSTTMRYTLYGSTGAYTAPGVQTIPPSEEGITSGTPLLTATIGISETLDRKWYALGSFSPGQGEWVGDRYLFKLAVEGLGGNDANWYRVALSTSPDPNARSVPHKLRMFAFYWALLVRETDRPRVHPYVRDGVGTFWLRGLGCISTEGRLVIRTPLRNLEARCSAEGRYELADSNVLAGEAGATWTADWSRYVVGPDNADYLAFWVEDGSSQPLPTFTRPTIATPP